MRRPGLATAAFVLLGLLGAGSDVLAVERLAVVIVVDDDRAASDRSMSDNLTEIAIAELAEGHDRELIGGRELRSTIAADPESGGLAECLARPTCLARVGDRVGARRAMLGSVHRQGASYALALALVEMGSAVRGPEVTRLVAVNLSALIAAVRESVSELSARDPRPTLAPLPAARLGLAGQALPRSAGTTSAAARAPNLTAPDGTIEERRSLLAMTGYGASGLAVVAFSASAVTGSIASEPPSGATRAEKQADLSRRVRDADLANAFLMTGFVLTALAGAALVWHWRH